MSEQQSFEGYVQRSESTSRSEDSNIHHYKEALQHLKTEYEIVQQTLFQKEAELNMLQNHISSRGSGQQIKDYQYINKIFLLRSQINSLKFESLREKEFYQKDKRQYESRLFQLEQELQAKGNHFTDQSNQVSSQNREELVTKLKEKGRQMMYQIQDLDNKNSQLEDQNQKLRNCLFQYKQFIKTREDQKRFTIQYRSKLSPELYIDLNTAEHEIPILKQKVFDQHIQGQNQKKIIQDFEENQKKLKNQLKHQQIIYEQQISKLKNKLKGQQLAQLNNEIFLNSKLEYSSKQRQRFNITNDNYRRIITQKEIQIQKINEKLLGLQIQKSKVSNTGSQVVQNLTCKIQQFGEENRNLRLTIKKMEISHHEQIYKIQEQNRLLQNQVKEKFVKLTQIKESFQNEEQQRNQKMQNLTNSKTDLQQQLIKKNLLNNELVVRISRIQKDNITITSELRQDVDRLNELLIERQNKIKQLNDMLKSSNKDLLKLSQKGTHQEDDYKNKLTLIEEQLRQSELIEKELREDLQNAKENILISDICLKSEKQQRRKQQTQAIQFQKTIKQLTNEIISCKQLIDKNNTERQQKQKQLLILITQLKADANKQKDKLKSKEQQIISLRGQISKFMNQKDLMTLRVDEMQSNNWSLLNKSEEEKQIHKKSYEKINILLEITKKQLSEAKKSEIKVKQQLFEDNLKNAELNSQLQSLKNKILQFETIKKRTKQNQEYQMKRYDDIASRLVSLEIQIQQKNETIRENQIKTKQQKDLQLLKIKKLQQDVEKYKQKGAQYDNLKMKTLQNQREKQQHNSNNQNLKLQFLEVSKNREREKDLVSYVGVNKLRRNYELLEKQKQQLTVEVVTLQRQIQIICRQNNLIKRELNNNKRTISSQALKIQQNEIIYNQLQNNYDKVLKEKSQLNQERSHEIKKLQLQIQILKTIAKQKQDFNVNKSSNNNSQLLELQSKILSLENKLQESQRDRANLQKKIDQQLSQKSLLQTKIQILQATGIQVANKQKLQQKKAIQQYKSIIQKQQILQNNYQNLEEQYQSLKLNHAKEVEILQKQIQQIKSTMLASKKKYQFKLDQEQQIVLLKQRNKVSQKFEKQIQKLKSEKQIIQSQNNALLKRISSLEETNRSIRQLNKKLVESNQVDASADQLYRRLSSMTQHIQDLKCNDRRYTMYDQYNNDKSLNYLKKLQQRCTDIQNTNIKLMNIGILQASPIVPVNNTKQNYFELQENYNDIIQTKKQLSKQKSRFYIEKDTRPQTNYYPSGFQATQQLKNAYREVDFLNNMIIDRDFYIKNFKQGVKETAKRGFSHTISLSKGTSIPRGHTKNSSSYYFASDRAKSRSPTNFK